MMKRGELNNTVLIEIILLVFITAAFFYFHMTVRDNTLFEKSYTSRDIALLLETSQSVPGDIVVYYSQPTFDVGKYSYIFTDNLVQVFEGNVSLAPTYYPFYLDLALYNALSVFQQPPAFVISKEKGTFDVVAHGTITSKTTKAFSCPSVASTKTEQLSLIVLADSDLSFAKIQSTLLNNPKVDFAKKTKTEDTITEKTNLVLVLFPLSSETEGTTTGTKILLNIPATDNQQSEKLACLIANAFLETFPDTDITYPIKSNNELLNKNQNGLAVEIILGTAVASQTNSVSTALTAGIEEYYE